MDKDFKKLVCSKCIHQNEEHCCSIKRKKQGSCILTKCTNYKMKEFKKVGEDKIARYFLYKILNTYYTENQKKFPENYFMS